MENESAKKIKLSITSHGGKTSESESSVTELDETGSAQLVLRDPGLSRPPEEAVFAIDHILESIFADLDRHTLLNCRLVSSRWGSCASQQLQKTLTIRFGDTPRDEPNKFYLIKVCSSERSLEDFIELMNNSANFPSTSFSFRNKYHFRTSMKICPLITPFLNAHGSTITKISIEDNNIWSCDLWRLLSIQAPNLEHLALNDVDDPEFQSSSFRDKQDEEKLIDLEIKKFSCGDAKLILKCLKVFKCKCISDVTLALLLSCASHLVEISVPFENLHVLLKPTNRLCLVKELHVNWPDVEGTESLKQIADHHENDLLLKSLRFEDFTGFSSNYSKAATFMCKILNASSATLEHLTWKGITGNFLVPPMSRVKHLNISYSKRLNHSLKLTRVPISISLAQTYPNIKSLFLSTVYRDDKITHACLADFFHDQTPVLSVTDVTSHFCPGERFLEQLREMFPKARLSIVEIFNGGLVYELLPPRGRVYPRCT